LFSRTKKTRRRFHWLVSLTIGWGCVLGWGVFPSHAQEDEGAQLTPAQTKAIEFYNLKVKPILEQNCFECHANDPDDLGGALALTSRASILRGGDSGPAVNADDPSESLILKVIHYQLYEMPPSGKLPDEKINVLTQWVKMGLPIDPKDEKDLTVDLHSTVPQVNAETKKWWSFLPVADPVVPKVKNKSWPNNEIDNFVLAKLESSSLTPASPASRRALVRRVYYDLLGLPPTPSQVEAFANNEDSQAYPQLIEELLASPHYGEKWGRHWLDLVRYAETNSFERDGAKPFVWRYRDYVIRSFNDDKPYDQFLIEQLAGDEIESPTQASIAATGYFRLGQWDDEPVDRLKAKYDDLDDIVATTSQTMLGLTVNCARCHDHKIDPIPQADYYKMVSFFENIRHYGVRGHDSVLDASVRIVPGEASEEMTANYEREMKKVDEKLEVIAALAKPDFESVEHEDFQFEMNKLPILKKRIGKQITKKQFNEFRDLLRNRGNLLKNPPGSVNILSVKESGPEPLPSFIRIRGNPNVKGSAVEPGFISVLSPPPAVVQLPAHGESTGRRLAFAKWLTGGENPLTARVMANRIWQYHFGRGIVRTSSDFGFQGSKPTHPQLLDWLAAEFVNQGWSMKAMHRLILMSKTYQMSSQFSAEGFEKDPGNDLLWRFNLRRLTAEEIRDSILAVSGELNLEKMYGPSIYPVMPREVLAGQSRPGSGWGNSSDEDRRRRSVYVHIKRSLGLPILTTNDSAPTDTTCPVRFITTQPTQALGMMNSDFTNQQAAKFAAAIEKEFPGKREAQVESILQKVTQRPPTEKEIQQGVDLIQSWIDHEDASPQQALQYYCLLAINLNEFAYID
jgi:mono/diheme cytochrome c family protein